MVVFLLIYDFYQVGADFDCDIEGAGDGDDEPS